MIVFSVRFCCHIAGYFFASTLFHVVRFVVMLECACNTKVVDFHSISLSPPCILTILTHALFRVLSLRSTNWCIWNMYRKKVIGGLTLLSI